MTIFTPFGAGEPPTTANFYLNGRAIGAGREGFAAVLERVQKLPAGTSIVWGPNYARCGSCSGLEPDCLPKALYPDLWAKLEASVEDRRLILSSAFPGPWTRPADSQARDGMPPVFSEEDPASNRRFDAALDWEVVESDGKEDEDDLRKPEIGEPWSRFSSAGKTLRGFDLPLFLGRLPEKAPLLIRITPRGKFARPEEEGGVVETLRDAWGYSVGENVRSGKLKATLTAPPRLAEALRRASNPKRLVIDWRNFHGTNTPHEEVLYLTNGRFVGRGDEGIDALLAELAKLPSGAEVVLPRYQHGGRAALNKFSYEELGAMNAAIRDLVPFAGKKAEFDAAILKGEFEVTFVQISPGEDFGTVMDWNGGDRYGQSFVSVGRIVRHDEKKGDAAIRLGWARYKTGSGMLAGRRKEEREPENAAFTTINDVEVGRGFAGFAKAMEQIAKLPEGSVVQVRICLRTKGPFICPLIYEGHRHFERSGFEPYVGLFPWLIDVARTHKLEIQWVPDEEERCWDCELNS